MTQSEPDGPTAAWRLHRAPFLARVLSVIARATRAWEARCDPVLADKRCWVAVIAAVLALQLALIATHRPWLDEWQAIQIAVQSPTWHDLLRNLRYEGHPPLWYAILRGLAHVVPRPALALPAAAAALAIPAQLAILLGAPFSRSARLSLALSEGVLFEFLTVSRSLTLGVACVLLAMALWRKGSRAWPFLILLPQCDFLFGVLSIVLVGLRRAERRAGWPWLALWAGSGLIAAWAVRPMPDIAPASTHHGALGGLADWLAGMSALGLPLQWHGLAPQWNSPPPVLIGAVALLALAGMVWAQLRAYPRDGLILAGFVGLTLVFSVAVYALAIRHLMLCALLLVVLVWRRAAWGEAGPGIWMRTWLWVTAACGLFTGAAALTTPFHTSAEAAAWIAAHDLKGQRWFAFPESTGQGVSALAGMRFERLGRPCAQTFTRWNNPEAQAIDDGAQLYRTLAAMVGHDGGFYLLSDFSLPDHPPLIRRMGDVSAGLDGQAFHFYRVGLDQPERGQRAPVCAGPVRPFARL